MVRLKHRVDKAYHNFDPPCAKGHLRVQIRMGRDVRCCVPGVARSRSRGWLSRNVSTGLTKAFILSVDRNKIRNKREKVRTSSQQHPVPQLFPT